LLVRPCVQFPVPGKQSIHQLKIKWRQANLWPRSWLPCGKGSGLEL
jgi:hypothetical protein